MQKPSVVDSPSGGALAKAPTWDLADTEGYGGGNSFPWSPLMFSGYVGIYRRKKQVSGPPRGPRDRGARPVGGRAQQGGLHPRGRLGCCLTSTPSPLDHVHSKNHASEGFIPFGLRLIFLFFETLKQAKKIAIRDGPPVSRLVPKMI